MTEAEWLACDAPRAMLEFLRGKLSDRKASLFACACCFHWWPYTSRSDSLMDMYEKALAFADRPGEPDLVAGWSQPGETWCWPKSPQEWAWEWASDESPEDGNPDLARETMASLLREVVGNPFAPLRLDPLWLAPAVREVAQAAYEERLPHTNDLDPVRLAVLADALEEAGCGAEELLSHLRSPGPHEVGCWALDLVLGKG